jgi:magnesium chelatase accessory protein
MAASLRDLLAVLEVSPAVVVGHSAGAAILIRMALDGYSAPRLVVSVNGAIVPLAGFPHWFFSPVARLLARNAWVSWIVSRRAANLAAVARLIKDTGSELDERGLRLYQQLLQRPSHVAAALSMMANWDLGSLAADIGRLRIPLKLFDGDCDRTNPPTEALRERAVVAGAEIVSLGSYGHLAHEENPQVFSDTIVGAAIKTGVLTPPSLWQSRGNFQCLAHHMQL